MTTVRCPICEKWFDSDQSRVMPFCSERCRLIDLGRWLDEKYGLPYEPQEKPEEPEPED
jgi:endogenous inhibitor of DNA gyrase (YacG/DUF329 family)